MSRHHHHAHHTAHEHPHGHAHTHAHDHGHAHGHDAHDHAAHASEQRIWWSLVVTVSAMVVCAIGGLLAHSLALVADAGHMLADAGSLLLSLLAARQALRPADATHSFGHSRMPVLAAFINGILLLAVSAWIGVEGIGRLFAPKPVDAHTMLALSVVGLVANGISLYLLHGGDEADLNRQGAAAHVMSDLLGSVAAIVAAIVILSTGWMRADPILSMFAAALVLRMGWRIVKESAHILLEGTPRHVNLEQLWRKLPQEVEGLAAVHHLHAWSLSHRHHLMTLHAVPKMGTDGDALIARLREHLSPLGITHLTVQIEAAACAQPACDIDPSGH